MMDYQKIVDEVLGNYSPHRSLRTIFDFGSTEWNETKIIDKILILKKILASDKITLPQLIKTYKMTYSINENNSHSFQKAIELILEHLIIENESTY